MLLPTFQQLVDVVYHSGILRQIGWMDCRHRWEPGQIVTWAISETPPLPAYLRVGREDFHEIQNVRVQHRTVTFRMKDIVIPANLALDLPERRWCALALEAGRLADLAFIQDFRELDEVSPLPRPFAMHHSATRRESREEWERRLVHQRENTRPIEPIATTASGSALPRDHIQRAQELLARSYRPAGFPAFRDLVRGLSELPRPDRNLPPFAPEPPTIEQVADGTAEVAALGEMNTRPECAVAGESLYRSTPDCDVEAPAHAKPLAPLPDWLKKVDEVIEETRG